MRYFVIAAVLAVSAMGCGSSENKKYQYVENGCDTGTHSFESLEAYCNGLTSNSLNNGCAEGMRSDAYQRDCGKTFFPSS